MKRFVLNVLNNALNNLSTRLAAAIIAAVAEIVVGGCGHLMAMAPSEVKRPAATEFGFGPRASTNRLYTATLQPRQPLRLRQLQTVPVLITDAHGRPVESASITVDGGMPEHAHGLPTRPQVGRSLGGGVYEINGVRFSMGGWWELKFAIESPSGADSVTFNLSL